MTDKKKLPSERSIHGKLTENQRLKAELLMLRASHNPDADLLTMVCFECGAPLQILPSGLRQCTPCTTITILKRRIAILNTGRARHNCAFLHRFADGCPVCTAALQGATSEELEKATRNAILIKRDFLAEIRRYQIQTRQIIIAASRVFSNNRELKRRDDAMIRLLKKTLIEISNLPTTPDNFEISKYKARNAACVSYDNPIISKKPEPQPPEPIQNHPQIT